MCGIAGILQRDGAPADGSLARRMSDAMAHRGPDGEGVFIDGPLAFSHRRLAVIDLTSAADQPMTRGRHTLVYNGEVYNFRALRAELEARGHDFSSTGDTEVVLAAFAEWGAGCVERFDGMFAMAVWDSDERTLFLARDAFGVKPLYWAQVGERFMFASEVKPLLEAGSPRAVEPAALQEYFTFQNVLSDRTLFAGVRILPPGSRMQVREGSDVPEAREWWRPVFEPSANPAAAGDIADLLRAAVRRELVADVPVGAYLSGGLDSGSIVALAAQERSGFPVFTGGFDMSSVSGIEIVFDERDQAASLAGHVGASQSTVEMREGDMARCLERLVWHLEDLRVGTSWQNWYVTDLASRDAKVVLAGTGGDEMFAGYPWRYEGLVGADDASARESSYRFWARLLDDSSRSEFFSGDLLSKVDADEPRAVFDSVFMGGQASDPVGRELAFEARTFLHGLLVLQDRIAMAHSLEERVPFLDRDLVAAAMGLPMESRYREGVGKVILREAMRELLPGSVVEAPKQGFSPPEGSWYRGQSVAYLQTVLLDERTLSRGYFRPEAVRQMIGEHVEGKRNHRLLIWSLLCFEYWNRLFIDGDVPEGT